jgi:tRNA A-37 threonylcarbamoyl transferase component Bud32/tetratricopeptide (TPR) repeat protein
VRHDDTTSPLTPESPTDMTATATPDWARAKDIFLDALDTDPDKRRDLIRERCADDRALREAVHRLLAGHESAADFLVETGGAGARTPGGTPPMGAAPGGTPPVSTRKPAAPPQPDAIGPYEILEKLGEGGHGTVYRAQQHAPVEREVAIKVLKPALDSQDVIARFADERRFLARMDHPDIVGILDAGGTPDGRLFVAMELVRGVPLTEYADGRRLDARARVALVARLARAVHHAHQRSVIHRDLKPTNVLVSEDDAAPRLRIIDFGIASTLGDGECSGHGVRAIGTPRYMSPEQAGAGGPVDTRADIYAMGVILCELLTGRTPRPPATGDASRSGPVAATPPSRLIDGADAPVRTPGMLRGDLDRIVLKCVAWEPDGRYASASELADDLDRHLAGLPVRATPPTPGYLLRRFVGRHRVAAVLGAAAVLSLGGGFALALQGRAAAIVQARAASEARAEAERQAARAQFVTGFLLEDMLAAADPDADPGREVTARELLDAAAASAGARFADDPALLADILGRIGVAYTRLGRNEDARTTLTEAIDLASTLRSDDGVRAEDALSWEFERAIATLMIPGRHKEAGEAFKAVAGRAGEALGATHPLTLAARLQASEYIDDTDARDAEVRAVEAATRGGGADEGLRMRALRYYASTLKRAGDTADAVSAFHEAHALSEHRLGADHTQTIKLAYRLAEAMVEAGETEEGLALARDTLGRARRVFGPAHGTLTGMQRMSVDLFLQAGAGAEAIAAARELVTQAGEQYGVDSIPRVSATQALGRALLRGGSPAEALAELEGILPLREAQWGPDHVQTAYTRRAIADAHLALGNIAEAEASARRAMDALPPSNPGHYHSGETLVRALAAQGRSGEADTLVSALRERAEASGADERTRAMLDALATELGTRE